jgi:hypothetical protein
VTPVHERGLGWKVRAQQMGWLVLSVLGAQAEFSNGLVTVTDYYRTNHGGKV